MFWAKCGKILTDGTAIINCPSNPCGWYSVFGIRYRNLDSNTMLPSNQCSWYYDVFPAQVKDSKVVWTNAYNVCITVQQKSGLVAKGKKRQGCLDSCVQWDQNFENCLRWQQYCQFCIQYQLFNLSDCFDTYDKFAQFFYDKCGVSADSNGKYPDIFSTYYGTVYPTEQAYNCVNNYWMKYFCDKYLLNFNLTVYNMSQWWILSGVHIQRQLEYHCYCPDTGIQTQGRCQDSSCNQSVYPGAYLSIGAYGDQNTSEHRHGSIVRSKYVVAVTADELGQKETMEDCCRQNAAREKIGQINQFFVESINNKNNYTQSRTDTLGCTNSNNLCKSFQYNSFPYDNYYGSMDQVRFDIQWRKLLLTKNDNTPSDAKGVKFELKLRNKKYDTGGTEQVVFSDQTTTTYINLMFGQEYTDLPLANYVNNGMTYVSIKPCEIDNGYCVSDWESNIETKNQPHVTYWYQDHYDNEVKRNYIKVDLKAIQYII